MSKRIVTDFWQSLRFRYVGCGSTLYHVQRSVNPYIGIYVDTVLISGPGSVVGIATGYGLDGLGIESRWGARFSAPVQTCPGAHPASCTMGTGSFQGVNSGRGVTLTPHPLLVPWLWKSRAIPLLPPYGPYGLCRASVPVQGCTLHFSSK